METPSPNAARVAAMVILTFRVLFLILSLIIAVLIIYLPEEIRGLNGEFACIPIFACFFSILYSIIFYRKYLHIILSGISTNLLIITFGLLAIQVISYGQLDRVSHYDKFLLQHLYNYSSIASFFISMFIIMVMIAIKWAIKLKNSKP